ncbi:hypothetical protein LCM23_13300 [Cytobacillus kochii]|uniref:hypothetical protein n=1 Tax=Cytobacillus kochii TaxID=859143 RepID=UPI001CD556A2|nr:hypothetical protein [Cytobacillus kochii]MCA1027072.1 hypothetical protein [Cytobacillus kochii]
MGKNMSYFDAVGVVEAELWNDAMLTMEKNDHESVKHKHALDVARIIDNYQNLIHNSMVEKHGEDYSKKFKIYY